VWCAALQELAAASDPKEVLLQMLPLDITLINTLKDATTNLPTVLVSPPVTARTADHILHMQPVHASTHSSMVCC
jgi:hypothetical protein